MWVRARAKAQDPTRKCVHTPMGHENVQESLLLGEFIFLIHRPGARCLSSHAPNPLPCVLEGREENFILFAPLSER